MLRLASSCHRLPLLVALGASACSSSPSPDPTEGIDSIAGLRDDCHFAAERGLYGLGAPANGQAGSGRSRYDATPDRQGRFGFYPLALATYESTSRESHRITTSAATSDDARCTTTADAVVARRQTRPEATPLDPAKYPEGVAEIDLGVDIKFAAPFPTKPSEVTALAPTARGEQVLSTTTITPSEMALRVRYLRPLGDGRAEVIDEQSLPMAFECKTAYPMKISWQPFDATGPFCDKNDAGDRYCLFYEVIHGEGGDCRFAIENQPLRALDGKDLRVDLAGSYRPIRESSKVIGQTLRIDVVHLR